MATGKKIPRLIPEGDILQIFKKKPMHATKVLAVMMKNENETKV